MFQSRHVVHFFIFLGFSKFAANYVIRNVSVIQIQKSEESQQPIVFISMRRPLSSTWGESCTSHRFVGHLWSVFCVITVYLLGTKDVFVLSRTNYYILCRSQLMNIWRVRRVFPIYLRMSSTRIWRTANSNFWDKCSAPVFFKASLILPLYVSYSKHCPQPCLNSSSLWALDPIKRRCWFYIFRRRGDI